MLRKFAFNLLYDKSVFLLSSRHTSEDTVIRTQGYTRSTYVEPEIIEYVDADGIVKRISSGLVGHTRTRNTHLIAKMLLKATYRQDYTIEALQKYYENKLFEYNKSRQKISIDNLNRLGPDIAIAKLVCDLGGRVKFTDSDEWVQNYQGIRAIIPQTFSPDRKLLIVDACGTPLRYEGLEYFQELRILRLRTCIQLDDFCLSRISRITSSKLELLDISDCPKISSNGLATLHTLKYLKHLFVENCPQIEEKELACLLLEDYLPKLLITGVDYLGKLDGDQKNHLLKLVGGEKIENVAEEIIEEFEKKEKQQASYF